MVGYQITFFTQQNRFHQGVPVANWLLDLAKEMDLRGATVLPADEGFGHDGHIHSAHFFDLAEQPIIVLMAVTTAQSADLFARLKAEDLPLFYVKVPIEYGVVGESDAQQPGHHERH